MSWTFKQLNCTISGEIDQEIELKDIRNNFKIERTVGNEIWIKTGDILIDTRDKFDSSTDWLAAYWNNELFDVFKIPSYIYDKHDQKWDHYEIRLHSIQRQFYEDLKTVKVRKTVDWGDNLNNAGLEINEIKLDNDSPLYANNRWGFSLGDMLEQMVGSESKGYDLDSVSINCPKMNDNDLPILYRGTSFDYGTVSITDAVEQTFYDYDVTWFDIFQFATFAFNAFIKVKPITKMVWTGSITQWQPFLGLQVSVIPRINITASANVTPHWKTRTYELYKHQIDGVHLTSTINDDNGNPSFEYSQGNTDGDKVIDRDVNVADPDASISTYSDTLYWSAGNYDSGTGRYYILDSGDNRPYFAEGLVEPYYSDMISAGHAYEGDIFFDNEDVLDQFEVKHTDGTVRTAQIIRMTIGRNRKAKIEAVKIA